MSERCRVRVWRMCRHGNDTNAGIKYMRHGKENEVAAAVYNVHNVHVTLIPRRMKTHETREKSKHMSRKNKSWGCEAQGRVPSTIRCMQTTAVPSYKYTRGIVGVVVKYGA